MAPTITQPNGEEPQAHPVAFRPPLAKRAGVMPSCAPSYALDEPNPASSIASVTVFPCRSAVRSFQVLYEKPAALPQTTFMGSWAHPDTSRYVYGWGGWATSDIEPAVTEVVNGQVTWSLTFTSPRVFSYRALPIPAL